MKFYKAFSRKGHLIILNIFCCKNQDFKMSFGSSLFNLLEKEQYTFKKFIDNNINENNFINLRTKNDVVTFLSKYITFLNSTDLIHAAGSNINLAIRTNIKIIDR
ncbi:hypothetical protein RFI_30704 [Reticulomyxa filosa]|uniref:Uncharacterized protein n=1 Tax=Reticulomyxa filosa TaxID=46433 RepID=X6LXL2_RETFI|nr:hypothetical protein RFI_30704 [Reticulomyxa filosa]|eukprot:ETO06688.1 hypothetical protein RFI_30704 [Reticulomyxa filosa]